MHVSQHKNVDTMTLNEKSQESKKNIIGIINDMAQINPQSTVFSMCLCVFSSTLQFLCVDFVPIYVCSLVHIYVIV